MNSPDQSDGTPEPGRAIPILLLLSTLSRGWYMFHRLGYRLVLEDLPDFLAAGGSDVRGWLGMARHLARYGPDFSYWMMGIRPPLYPATVALVYRLGGNNVHALLLQTAFGIGLPLAGYWLALRLFCPLEGISQPNRAAFIAGLVMVFDPASIVVGTVLLSEPLFNLMMAGFLVALTLTIQDFRWLHIALACIFLALTMLTRPTAIYLWLAAPAILIPLMKAWWKPALALALTGLLVYVGWSAQNYQQRGLFTYSMQTNFTLLFLRALSAEYLATGESINDLRVAYAQEVFRRVGDEEAAAAAGPDTMWELHVAPTPQIYHTMGELARERLLAYWPYAVAGTAVGFFRMFALTNDLPGWFVPVELVYHACLYGLALYGAWEAFRRRELGLALVCLVPILYITGLTLASQTSAMDTRMRSAITAPIVVLAVAGGMWRWARRNATRHTRKDGEA